MLSKEEMQAITASVVAALAQTGMIGGTVQHVEAAPTGRKVHSIAVKGNGKEHHAEGAQVTFSDLAQKIASGDKAALATVDSYYSTVFACRNKDEGVYFYGCFAPFAIAARRFYIGGGQPLSAKQAVWLCKDLARDARNLAVFHDRYPALKAELTRKGTTALQIIAAQEADRKARKASA